MQVADEVLHGQTRFMDAKLQKVRTQQVIVIRANVWLDVSTTQWTSTLPRCSQITSLGIKRNHGMPWFIQCTKTAIYFHLYFLLALNMLETDHTLET